MIVYFTILQSIYMFTQFLHPELVLFGEFINPKIKTKHEAYLEDGQFVVNQRIQRRQNEATQGFNQISEFLNRRSNSNQQGEQGDYEPQQYQHDLYQQYQDDQGYEDDYEDYDQQPYGEQEYAYGAEDEQVPKEIADIIHQAMLANSPTKIKNKKIPFVSASPNIKPQTSHSKPVVQAQDIEDDEWETEEEQQDYAVVELMQEVGGVFEGQLGEM